VRTGDPLAWLSAFIVYSHTEFNKFRCQSTNHIKSIIMKALLVFLGTVLLAGCRPSEKPTGPASSAPPQPSSVVPAVPPKSGSLRVLTYNIRHGEGLDHKIDLARIAEIIKKEKADIVALQEVEKGVKWTSGRDLTAELAALTGMTGVFGNNFSLQGGESGNGILSRFPVIERTNILYKMDSSKEQHGALKLVLDVHGKKVAFLSTHLDNRSDDTERLRSVAELNELVAQSPMPVILCGDFSSKPDSRTHIKTKEFLADSWELAGEGVGFSFPAGQPQRRIDYIWISTNSISPVKLWVPQTEASDHRPVVGDYILK
jgi:endonuclease/exonuclease/phosphatase family metal-dependent hydrolase